MKQFSWRSGLVPILILIFCPIGVSAEDEARLAALGYDAAEYSLLMGWEEQSLGGRGPLVHGYRIAPTDGGAAFDVYTDEAGGLLDGAALTRLGVKPKNWVLRGIARDAEVSTTPKRFRTTPQPAAVGIVPRSLTLAPVDVAGALAEDEAGLVGTAKGVQRIGILRELSTPVRVAGARTSAGDWRRMPDGSSVWRLELVVPDALGLRIHFAAYSAPAGARLIVYNSDNPSEAYGPLPVSDGYWTPTCFSPRVTVELLLPEGAAIGEAAVEIDRVACRYRGFDGGEKQGDCNNDWSCHAAWRDAGLGVGGIGSVGDDGELWCTGALLADGETGTDIPYFLTAHHCVGSASESNSIEVYWLYQSADCGGLPPDPATVPRSTGGADYLASSSETEGNDFSLLRLREAPPAGTVYLGYQEMAVSVGAEVVCIHHPRGSFKRISFGQKINTGSPTNGNEPRQPYARFHEALWYDGTTEPGSSGSPLILRQNMRIIGQLWGGRASCALDNEPDYYGRFDVTHPIIEQWVGSQYHPYDFNRSGRVDAADAQLVVLSALTLGDLAFDLDASGHVDAADVQLIVLAVLEAS